MEMSQLLVPGPRNASFGALPQVPCGVSAKAPVLMLWSKVRSLLGRTGFAITLGRDASVVEPDQLFAFPEVSERVTPLGAPLMNVVMPDICQPSSITGASLVARGSSQ